MAPAVESEKPASQSPGWKVRLCSMRLLSRSLPASLSARLPTEYTRPTRSRKRRNSLDETPKAGAMLSAESAFRPTFYVEGVLHYCVANMPGAVPRASTFALTNATLPYALRLANHSFQAAVKSDPGLAGRS